ncbi:MAG: hypothetical protein M1839_005244 [Geoglossum umbratile]|nr:MAG: hypothetical protein M1839_005244 [Geoglossum umbratile]
MNSPEAGDSAGMDGYSSSRRSKFRFKSKPRSKSDDGLSTSRRSRHARSPKNGDGRGHRYHHSKRRRGSQDGQAVDDPTLYDDTFLPNSHSFQYLSPDDAFRESLFDAMADDEGAAYWEGVYGQPLHLYPKDKLGPHGELEQMTDEEYTAYVRAKMYEKTHQHIVEERARREAAKERQSRVREEDRKTRQENEAFERRISESLRRGEERKRKKRQQERWEKYSKAWQDLGSTEPDTEAGQIKQTKDARHRIPWPVETGRFSDITREAVEKFFLNASSTCETVGESPYPLALLKTERVRWHPDKMQQRLGTERLDQDTMGAVTAVFQVVDRMWSELRDKKASDTG